MSIYYYHPLGSRVKTFPRNIGNYYTYLNADRTHAAGELDLGVTFGEPQYAMCDGVITAAGYWADGKNTTYAILECKGSENGLGETFYIRYLHGDYTVKTGDVVRAGDKIGTTSNHGYTTGPHLHIGFSEKPTGARDPAVSGKLSVENGKHYYTYKGKKLAIDDDLKIDWNLIDAWKGQLGCSYDDIGYCWLVMASELKYRKKEVIPSSSSSPSSTKPSFPSSSSSYSPIYNKTMDMSSKLKTDNDWLALYGMLQYEEAGLASQLNTDISKAICEWVIRVFRNRLFSGISIRNICLWNSNQPGYNTAVDLGKKLPQKARSFCKDIISGYDYFYVEKVAQQYKFYGTKNWSQEKWFNRLYSADTFSGGSSARWPDVTLAAVPFSGGPRFYMEGEFTNEVSLKFWPNGRDGKAAYPNPYLSR